MLRAVFGVTDATADGSPSTSPVFLDHVYARRMPGESIVAALVFGAAIGIDGRYRGPGRELADERNKVSFGDIVRETGCDPRDVRAALVDLEGRGCVELLRSPAGKIVDVVPDLAEIARRAVGLPLTYPRWLRDRRPLVAAGRRLRVTSRRAAVIARIASFRGGTWITPDRIAADLGVDERTVRRTLADVVAAGVVRAEWTPSGNRWRMTRTAVDVPTTVASERAERPPRESGTPPPRERTVQPTERTAPLGGLRGTLGGFRVSCAPPPALDRSIDVGDETCGAGGVPQTDQVTPSPATTSTPVTVADPHPWTARPDTVPVGLHALAGDRDETTPADRERIRRDVDHVVRRIAQAGGDLGDRLPLSARGEWSPRTPGELRTAVRALERWETAVRGCGPAAIAQECRRLARAVDPDRDGGRWARLALLTVSGVHRGRRWRSQRLAFADTIRTTPAELAAAVDGCSVPRRPSASADPITGKLTGMRAAIRDVGPYLAVTLRRSVEPLVYADRRARGLGELPQVGATTEQDTVRAADVAAAVERIASASAAERRRVGRVAALMLGEEVA